MIIILIYVVTIHTLRGSRLPVIGSAWRNMLVRYYNELLGFFVRAVKDPHEAQELVQETFERVLARMHAGEQIDQARPFLFEIARNLLIDRYRHLKVRQHDTDDVLEQMAGPVSCEPEVIYAGMQRVHALVSTIERLPPRCRMAFVLHQIEGLSHAEVALAMGVGLNAVERHIMLAVAACRKALGDEFHMKNRKASRASATADSQAQGD